MLFIQRTGLGAALGLTVCSMPALAALTVVQGPASGESGHKQIFEGVYGGTFVGSGTDLGNGLWSVFDNGTIVATRVDDSGFATLLNLLVGSPGSGDDDVWTDGVAITSAQARYAGFTQEFGYDAGSGYVKLFDVSGTGFAVSGLATIQFGNGAMWQWARANDSDSGLTNPHYSDPASNGDGLDHMVTYHITGLPVTAGTNVWVAFFEDVSGGGSDRDFNDLAVEIQAVECLAAVDCDDADLCTTDACVDGFCDNTPVNCPDNGAYCDGTESCNPANGQCTSSGNPCSGATPVCCEASDSCVAECCDVADCDDSDPCTVDSCSAGVCSNLPKDCSALNGPCVTGVCNATTGVCEADPTPNNGAACDDGVPCTVNDTCSGGTCSGTPKDCSALSDQCNTGVCNPTTGVCFADPTPHNGAACSDGQACTTGDVCSGGSCAGTSVVCPDDGDWCTGTESCDPASGLCVSSGSPCSAPTPVCCDATQTCVAECCTVDDCGELRSTAGLCTLVSCVNGLCEANPVDCPSDGAYCNGTEACNPANGLCESGGNPCTAPTGVCCEADDSCVTECCFDAECDDSLLCTTDSCVAGACQHSPVNCPSDGTYCNGPEACNPANGLCEPTGNPCSAPTAVCCEADDSCVTECCFDADCNDSLLCTTDACVAGACQYTPVNCPSDGTYCNGPEACNPANGLCEPTGNPCSAPRAVCCEADDSCVTECCFDADCNDSLLCTTDACVAGACQYTPVNCPSDGTYCNGPEACNPANGLCEPTGNPCSAPTAVCCEADDSCVTECCTNADCDDSLMCTTDSCVAGVCQHTPVNCPDDGNFCNGTESCNPANGQCVSSGNPCSGGTAVCCEASDSCVVECCDVADCGDGNLCTTDSCVAGVCQHAPVDCPDDGNFCNGTESCSAASGQCVSSGTPCSGGTPVCCEAGDSCVSQCCNVADCGDGDLCTTDACVNGACQHAAINCPDDGDFCNGTESCSAAIGCVSSGNPCSGGTPTCCEPTDTCVAGDCPTIPTVSEWGVVALSLLLLVGAKLRFGRRLMTG